MKDLDFDELDKAVNSLISGDPKNLSSAPVATPAVSNQPSSQPEPTVAADPAASLAGRRSAGRFMDVVHPSSDMRPSAATPIVPAETPKPVDNFQSAPTIATEAPKPASSDWPDPIDFHEAANNQTKTTEDDDIDKISKDITNTLGGSGD